MAPLSCTQFKTMLDRILKKINSATFTDELSFTLLYAAKSSLQFFSPAGSPEGSSQSSMFFTPDPGEIDEYLRDLVPPPWQIFTQNFFTMSLFPVTVLVDVAELYGFGQTPIEYVQALSLSPADKNNKCLVLHVWLSFFLDCGTDLCSSVVQKYKSHRGSPKPLYNGIHLYGSQSFGNAHEVTCEARPSLLDSRALHITRAL